jgi:two-component system OmpR family response regulator
MHILLIEDDPRVAAFVAKSLREAGHLVEHCTDGADGFAQARAERYDAIVLDRMLPTLGGLAVLEAIRGIGDTTPVLILSALGDTEERVRGLRAGSDDYLAKPFSVAELLARVEALGRRQAAGEAATRITTGELVIDLAARLVKVRGTRVDLTEREFRILEYLARNQGRVVTRSMLLEHVWDYSFDPQTNIIDQHVSRLRQKLDRAGAGPLIETVRGAGYSIGRSGS